jgi:hypothetical protein
MAEYLSRRDWLAASFFVAAIQKHGFPSTDGDTAALARDSYHAAEILLREGQRVDTVIRSATRGAAANVMDGKA